MSRRWLEQLLHTHDTPQRTAAAYALGVFFGFSPFLGLHTVLGLLLAFALNLNRVAVLLGIYSNLPWILVPYYTLTTWLGAALLQTQLPPGLAASIITAVEDRSWADFRTAIGALRPFLWAFTIGSTLGAGALALIANRVALAMLLTHHRHRHKPQHSEM